MNHWTPLFSKIVDSSVWGLPDHVCKVFITLLALKDADHIVRANAYQLGVRARKSEKEVLEALKILSSPDKDRLEAQPYEGRRIKKVEEGWLLLNGGLYLKEMQACSKRDYQKRWVQEKRALKKGKPSPGEEAYVKKYENDGQEAADRTMP